MQTMRPLPQSRSLRSPGVAGNRDNHRPRLSRRPQAERKGVGTAAHSGRLLTSQADHRLKPVACSRPLEVAVPAQAGSKLPAHAGSSHVPSSEATLNVSSVSV